MTADTDTLDALITGRRSIRAFLPTPLARAVVEDILRVASRAPSGTNMQPWRVHVLTGAALGRLCDAVCAAWDAADGSQGGSHTAEYPYYPASFFEPYLTRRRTLGLELYRRLGIARGETAHMRAQHRRNFRFFDAPVGLMFSIDRRLALGSWLDYGMFLQNVMLAARARGLDTCPQAAWIDYHRIVAAQLGFGEHEQLVCGMALGHADPEAAENALHTEREPVAGFAAFHD